jgi:cobyrinic acid a,c-diamide synthase
VLVVDAAAMARSVAALVHGYRSFDAEVDVAGVVFNQVGSDHHEQLLREALEPLGVHVLGALRRDPRVSAPERHLGLVPARERERQARAALAALAAAAERHLDLDAIAALARSAPPLAGPAWSPDATDGEATTARIAVAAGPAFSFHYEENLELLRAAGAELVPFDPLCDERLPDRAGALLLAGGFPEVFGPELEANAPLRAAVARFARSGRPILAECGGLLFLCRELDGHEMCGVLCASARMGDRLNLGYREATAASQMPWLDAGERVRGHEFHYSEVDPRHGAPAAWVLAARGRERPDGFVAGAVQASYLHVHWAAHPRVAWRFARAAAMPALVAA